MNPQTPDPYQPSPVPSTPTGPEANPTPTPAGQPPVAPLGSAPSAEPSYDVNYLNSIAAPAAAKRVSPVMLFSMIGGVIAIAIAALLVMIAPHSASDSALLHQAADRASTIWSLADDQTSRLNDPDLASANLLIASSFKSITSDFSRLAASAKTDDKPSKQKVNTSEDAYYDTVAGDLEVAYQRGTLDTAYPTQMVYELQVYQSQLRSFARSSDTPAVQAACSSALESIDTLLGLLLHEVEAVE